MTPQQTKNNGELVLVDSTPWAKKQASFTIILTSRWHYACQQQPARLGDCHNAKRFVFFTGQCSD